MASFVETYVNPRTGQRRKAPQGFSWTTLFFGGFVPLLRGDVRWFVIMWLVTIVTGGVAWFVFPFIYNDRYTSLLRNDGFEAEAEAQSGSSSLLRSTR